MSLYVLTACPHCNAVLVEVAVLPVFHRPSRGQLTSGQMFDWQECRACKSKMDAEAAEYEREALAAQRAKPGVPRSKE